MTLKEHLEELSSVDRHDFQVLASAFRAMTPPIATTDLSTRILRAVAAEANAGKKQGRVFPFSVLSSSWRWIGAAAGLLLLVSLSVRHFLTGMTPAEAEKDEEIVWLTAQQEIDGAWSPALHGGSEAYRPALTALSALALAERPAAKSAVDAACHALSAMQRQDGSFGGAGRARAYNNSVTTYALATLVASRDELRPVLQRALQAIAQSQTPAGGWDYETNSQGNTALTAWNLRALSEAEKHGFAEARVPLRKGLRWLRDTTRDLGAVVYHRGGPVSHSESLLALTAHVLLTAGEPFPALPDIGRRIVRSLSGEKTAATADSYRDYAKVLAFNAAGVPEKAAAVLSGWRRDAPDDVWTPVGGRLYTSALAVLAGKK